MISRSVSSFLPAVALALALPTLAPTLAHAQAAKAPALATYTIDPVHSSVAFKIKHLLVSNVSGRFTKFQGTIKMDPNNLASSSVDVTIDAASVSTDEEARDKHLRTDTFFDVAKFPTITFKSDRVTPGANGDLAVTGQFTMHGVTRTITLPVTGWASGPGGKPGTVVAGGEAILTLKRSDYGMDKMVGPVGDEVKITLDVEADKQ
jgi:polyisoprenoid-binding protein YceI